jgi:hypothetical protein
MEDECKKEFQRDSLLEMYRDFLNKEGYTAEIDLCGE